MAYRDEIINASFKRKNQDYLLFNTKTKRIYETAPHTLKINQYCNKMNASKFNVTAKRQLEPDLAKRWPTREQNHH